jgi:hypothetical protein
VMGISRHSTSTNFTIYFAPRATACSYSSRTKHLPYKLYARKNAQIYQLSCHGRL